MTHHQFHSRNPAPQGVICGTTGATPSVVSVLYLPTSRAFGLGIFLAFMAGMAGAEARNISGSTVTMGPTDEPGAVAQIEFQNRPTNGPKDEGAKFLMTSDGLTVVVTFDWNAASGDAQGRPDAITVHAPEGYYAVPNPLVVQENASGVLHIYPEIQEGM